MTTISTIRVLEAAQHPPAGHRSNSHSLSEYMDPRGRQFRNDDRDTMRSETSRFAAGAFALMACCAPVVGLAQATTVPTRSIGKVDVEYPEPFTTVTSVRELRDGRVIVADRREKTLQLIDLARGSAVPIGRSGAGPAEWGNPGVLFAMPGDTTMMPDFGNDRFFFINPDGKPGTTLRLGENNPLQSGDLIGLDGADRALVVSEQRATNPREGTSGIAHVVRVNRRTGRSDTVGTLAKPKGEIGVASMLGGGMMKVSTNLPLAAQDLAAIAPDGRIVIVRAEPYRVEFFALDGKHTTGPVATSSGIRINDAEKEAFTRSQIRPGAILTRGPAGTAPPPTGGGGVRGASRTPQLSSAEVKAMMNPDMTWPAVKPPFLAGAVQVDRTGRVWVLRTRAWNDSIPTFDVFDTSGRVVERVTLPRLTRLVGFGNGVVYLARTDDDDLIWLQRVRR